MNELVKQMQEDASSVPEDNMGKIGSVANDIADTDKGGELDIDEVNKH